VSEELEKGLEAATGYFSLGLREDAWNELESLPPELRAHESVIELRVEILLKLERWEFAPAVWQSRRLSSFPETRGGEFIGPMRSAGRDQLEMPAACCGRPSSFILLAA
jgi:hypothetical protein